MNQKSVSTQTVDFFGACSSLDKNDITLNKLRAEPTDIQLFAKTVTACLLAAVAVLGRQYEHYFQIIITKELATETQCGCRRNHGHF